MSSTQQASEFHLSCLNFFDKTTNLTEWYALGTCLELRREDLVDIEQRFLREGLRRCKIELFYLWTKSTPDASWEQLAAALERIGENTLADQIRTHLQPLSLATVEEDQYVASSSQSHSSEADPNSDVVKVELDEKLVETFYELEKKYAVVLCALLTSLEKLMKPKKLLKAKILLKDLQRFVQVRLDEHELFDDHDAINVDDLFHRIRHHYDFFNTHILEEIVDMYFGKGRLKKQLDEYKCERDEFIKKANVSFLKEMKDKLSSRTSAQMPQVVFKLTGYWLKVTVARLQKFVEHIFQEEAYNFTHICVKTGCVCISWSIRMSAVSALVTLAKQKLLMIQLAGVLRLSVGDTVIMEQEDTVALPLLHATVVESLQFEEQETAAAQKAIARLRSLWVSLRHSVGSTAEKGEEIQHKDSELEYTACMFYTRIAKNSWMWHFLVIKKLDALIQHMRNTYNNWEGASFFQFQFAGKKLWLNLKKEYSHQGWMIVPIVYPSVITVDKCNAPQSIEVEVTAREAHDGGTAPYISYPVSVYGISPAGIKVFIRQWLLTEAASSAMRSGSGTSLKSTFIFMSFMDTMSAIPRSTAAMRAIPRSAIPPSVMSRSAIPRSAIPRSAISLSAIPTMSAILDGSTTTDVVSASTLDPMSRKPTMSALIRLKMRDGSGYLNIIWWITSLPYKEQDYFIYILLDLPHVQMFSEHNYELVWKTLEKWINEDDYCSWEVFIDCVAEIDVRFAQLLRENIPEVAEPFPMVATATYELKPFNRPPQLDQLFSQVAHRHVVQYKWREIGLQLDIPNVDKLYLEYKHPSYPYKLHRMRTGTSPTLGRRQCETEIGVHVIMDIFCEWKERGHPPYTWATIIDVLKSPEVDEAELAQELEQWLVRQ